MKPYFLFSLACLVLLGTAQANPIQDFTVVDTAGKPHHLNQYRGKWLIVNYWATWCAPCLEEVPDLIAFYEAHNKRDAMVLGVALEYPSTKEVNQYVNDMLMSYPIILGDDQAAGQVQHPDVLPTTYIYNPKGELVKVKKGLVSKHYLDQLIQQNHRVIK